MLQNLIAFIVRNVRVVPAEITKQYIPFIRPVTHEVFVQMSLKASTVKTDSFTLLRSPVVIYQVLAQNWRQYMVAGYVVDRFVGHRIACDVSGLPALAD